MLSLVMSISLAVSPVSCRDTKVEKIMDAIISTLPTNNGIAGCRNKPTPATIRAIAEAVVEYSKRYRVPIPLVLGIMRQESAFCQEAVSSVGAIGIMQLMPATAEEQIREINKPLKPWVMKDNIHIGIYYLSKRLIDFDGNVSEALRAYNAGYSRVKSDFVIAKGYATHVTNFTEIYSYLDLE